MLLSAVVVGDSGEIIQIADSADQLSTRGFTIDRRAITATAISALPVNCLLCSLHCPHSSATSLHECNQCPLHCLAKSASNTGTLRALAEAIVVSSPDAARVAVVLRLLQKILENVVSDVNEPKFRSLARDKVTSVSNWHQV